MSGNLIARRFQMATAGALAALGLFAAAGSAAVAMECEDPKELTFAIIPTEETVAELQLYQPITDRMEKLLSCPYTPRSRDKTRNILYSR